jgi:hypothetical protein
MKRVRLARPGFIAAASVAATVALALGTSQAGEAATAPSAGWHAYTPAIGVGSLLSIYAPSASDAWAAGESSSGGSLYQHFNGTAWENVSGPAIGETAAIGGTSDSDLWVLSASSSAHYNGSSWTTDPLAIPAGSTGAGDQYEISDDQVYVAGPGNVYAVVAVTVTVSTANEELLEHFNGKAWSVVTGIPNVTASGADISQVTGTGPDNVYVSAAYDNVTKSELAHFNGKTWSLVRLPGTPFGVDLEFTGAGQALALGSSNGAGYAAKLSGGKWTMVAMPFTHALPVGDAGGTGHAWAEMVNYASTAAPTLWQWSAGKWTQIKPDNTDGGVLTGAADGSGVWAFTFGTIFTGDAGTSVTNLFVG